MANIILFYKLKPEVTAQQFESWLRDTNFPALRALKHVKGFMVYKVEKRVMSMEPRSYDYVEMFDVPDLPSFLAEDLAADKTQKFMAEFRGFVDAPEYLLTEPVR